MILTIKEDACRGCQFCIDICPTDVFTFDEAAFVARVREVDDCIACLSCAYICPSVAIDHQEFHVVQNYYRDLSYVKKLEKFL